LLEDGCWHTGLAQGGIGEALAFGGGLDRCYELLLERIEVDRLVLGREALLKVEPLLDQIDLLGRVRFGVDLRLDGGGILGRLAPARLVGLSLKSGKVVTDRFALTATLGECCLCSSLILRVAFLPNTVGPMVNGADARGGSTDERRACWPRPDRSARG
jgi:hypothetical protein